MGYNDFVAGQQHARFLGAIGDMRATEAVRDWENYARQLEAKLAQAQAETLAARIQRNAYRNEAVRLSGMDEVTYRKRMGEQIIQPELAKNGLRLDAQGNVYRGR